MKEQVQTARDATTKQLETARNQARTAFEDSLAREYREIACSLPVSALVRQHGPAPGTPAFDNLLPQFYSYFDLSNEQAFLDQTQRVLSGGRRNRSGPSDVARRF